MPNQYKNKVVYNGSTLIDLTGDTVDAAHLLSGYTAHDASGAPIVGTASSGGSGGNVWQDENGYVHLDDDAAPGQIIVDSLSVTQNGTYTAQTGHAYSPVTVSVGGSASMDDPIRFFDYDGTLVASYTAVPSSLPSVPTHTGLTNGAWNYTLAQVTSQFNAMGTCDVGANYETTSGATEIDVVFDSAARLSSYLRFAVYGTVTIDWGDGSATESVNGNSLTSRKNVQHVYASTGSYTIKLTPASGTTYAMFGTQHYTLLHNNKSSYLGNVSVANCVRSVRLGTDCTLGDYSFCYCEALESVSLPYGLVTLGKYVFDTCYALKFVALPSSVTAFGSDLLHLCHNLLAASLPLSISTINSYAFNYCQALRSVSIPKDVTEIGNYALAACPSMKEVNIPSGVTTLGNYTFYDCRIIKSVTLPETCTTLGNAVFSGCYALQSVQLSSDLTSLPNSTMNNCNSLRSMQIPNKVTSIGNSAFSTCYSLRSLTIPASVESIGTQAFASCCGIMEYHFLRTESVPTLAGTNAFSSIQSDCKIYVPSSKLSDYQTAENWSTYASYMVGE